MGPALVLMALATACAASAPDVALDSTPSPRDPAVQQPASPPPADVAWRHLATTEGTLNNGAAAEAVESRPDLEAAWSAYALPADVPQVDFKTNVVLLLGQPDDACVDELVGLEVRNGLLRVEWLPPPGGCNLPLIFRIHAVQVDRRHLPATFDVAFPQPFEGEAKPVTLEIAAVEGQPPPAPAPPQSMTKAELDAVFAGHPVRRCTPQDDPLQNEPDSGVVTDDPPPRREVRVQTLSQEVHTRLRSHGYRVNVDFVPFISRAGRIRPGVWIDDGNAPKVRRLLDDEFGNGGVLVVENRYDFEAVQKAQRQVGELMAGGGDGPGSIVASAGIPGPVSITMIDPTREALDRIAATVDPSVVCVGAALSGVDGAAAQDGGG